MTSFEQHEQWVVLLRDAPPWSTPLELSEPLRQETLQVQVPGLAFNLVQTTSLSTTVLHDRIQSNEVLHM